jgi:dienelactone hydrolase
MLFNFEFRSLLRSAIIATLGFLDFGFLAIISAGAAEPTPLAETRPLDWPEDDLSSRMMDGLHRYIERKIEASPAERKRYWQRDTTSAAAYEKSIEPNRARFRQQIGLVDSRVASRLERFSTDSPSSLVGETAAYRVFQVRWEVLEGVTAEGLLLLPRDKVLASVVALPDADQTPEQLAGLAPGIDPAARYVCRLAGNGCRVLIPVLLDRTDEWSGNPQVAMTNQTHREWIYRQSFQMGRHVIGYEVQKVLAAVDWFAANPCKPTEEPSQKIGVAGYGEGALVALYAAACDPRIDACLVSGYFAERTRPWEEPLYRNVWALLREFGDAELATLVAPRGLVIEYSAGPQIEGPPAVRAGRKGGAAVGRLDTPAWDGVQREFTRIDQLLPKDFQTRYLIHDGERPIGPGSKAAMEKFAQMLSLPVPPDEVELSSVDSRGSGFDPRDRQRRQVQELDRHVQRLVRNADYTRDRFFLGKPELKTRSVEEFAGRTPEYRKHLWEEVLGRLDDPLLPANPRSRKIYDRPKWTGYDVVLDVSPDVFAWGALLIPKDLKPGERRPVIVCQHGRNGLPRDTIEGDHRAYHDYAAKLADRGFIVFSPHNPYRGEDRYRFLSRKANSVKASLFSFILAQHEQILNYLEKLPFVDPERIAFYGLSYGGETAVRVPPLLERYCLSICSADFNDWARKVASTDSPYSFMFTIEWEMPYFNMGSTFNYYEMASLMIPRPFMVERGHSDGVAPDEWVAYEYAKVRRLYDEFNLGDRTEIEFFNGPHTINGVGTFRFLEKQLQWPQQAGKVR